MRRETKRHETECPKWPINCDECDERVLREALPLHKQEECLETEMVCPHCSVHMKRGDHEWHVEQQCAETQVTCQFLPHGCDWSGKRGKLEEHLESAMGDHLSWTSERLESAYRDVDLLKKAVANTREVEAIHRHQLWKKLHELQARVDGKEAPASAIISIDLVEEEDIEEEEEEEEEEERDYPDNEDDEYEEDIDDDEEEEDNIDDAVSA